MSKMDPFMGGKNFDFDFGMDFLDSSFNESELFHGDEPDFQITQMFNSTVDNLVENELTQDFTTEKKVEDLSDESIQKLLTGNKAKETKYKDKCSINRLQQFMASMDPPDARSVLDIPAKELDTVLCNFFINTKKVNELSIKKLGELYQPDTLSSFRNAWQRHLSDNGSSFNIKTDKEFERSRKVLATRRKQLTSQGLGNKPMATRPLTDSEVNYLFDAKYFGNISPISLQRAVWWTITLNFGYRGHDESRKLRYGDIKLCVDADGTEFLEWDVERGSKTRSGESSGAHQRSFNPRAYSAQNKQQCPVAFYKEFVERHPLSSCRLDAPFFLAMIPEARIHSDTKVWYYDRPLGKNLIGEFLSKATEALKDCPMSSVATDLIQSRSRSKVANHSARKTAITTLLNNNVDPLHVSQLSGHKSTESLKSYHTASSLQQRQMSDIINRNNQMSSTSGRPALQSISANKNIAVNASGNKSDSIFNGATIHNCTFTINNYYEIQNHYKRKRITIDSDSDSEN